MFTEYGVGLAVEACQKAIDEWGGSPQDITHIVAVTCTDSSNPGYHESVARELGLKPDIDKVLLHGAGCSGGLAALRTAANALQGATYRGKPGRALVIATEINSSMVRSAFDQCEENGQPDIAVALFSDCASALVLSNGMEKREFEQPIYRLLNWKQSIIPNTESDIQVNVHPKGLCAPFPAQSPVPC
jgi:type III polyketide synthase